jgi:hypothetical protein
MTPTSHDETRSGPWNPGIQSQIPADLLPLATVFRQEHVLTALQDVRELHDLTGLPLTEIVAFRPQRLALHELLVRVTANLSVPDGTRIEDLGIGFRKITQTILERHIAPAMAEITSAYDTSRDALAVAIRRELARSRPASVAAAPQKAGWFARFARLRTIAAPVPESAPTEMDLVAEWEACARAPGDAVQRAAARALAKVVSALLVKHGALWGASDVIGRLATDIAANELGSDVIGALIEPIVASAASQEGYRLLNRQEHPLVMNTKGPSAAGKSTMRPLQKSLAQRIGVDWSDFALISPDIWRKQLLDYAGLGPHYKYAGAFTGEELSIIDQKLDRYMARKAERGEMSHLLIDRFRFDSFAPYSDEAGSNLLTRFGQIVYLFFLITPPAALVERAWNRGLDVGRYKAVDDTLAHAVEAYSGMPELFFTWARRADKRVHFEFLDNTVARGEPPRTAAFGWNDVLNVLDVRCLVDIERYRKIDINARAPDELYGERPDLAPEHNAEFLIRCVATFREVNFTDQDSGRVYLRVVAGSPAFADSVHLARATADPDLSAALAAAVPAAFDAGLPAFASPQYVARDEHTHTVGTWGTGDPRA